MGDQTGDSACGDFLGFFFAWFFAVIYDQLKMPLKRLCQV